MENIKLVKEKGLSFSDFQTDMMYLDKLIQEYNQLLKNLNFNNIENVKNMLSNSSLPNEDIKRILSFIEQLEIKKIETQKQEKELNKNFDKLSKQLIELSKTNNLSLDELKKSDKNIEKLISILEKNNSKELNNLIEKIQNQKLSEKEIKNSLSNIIKELNFSNIKNDIENNINKEINNLINETKQLLENSKNEILNIKSIYEEIKNSEYLSVKEKDFLKDLVQNEKITTNELKEILKQFQSNELESKTLIKYLSNYMNAIEKSNLSKEEKEKYETEISNILKEYKTFGKMNDIILSKIENIEKIFPKNLKLEDQQKLLENMKYSFSKISDIDTISQSIIDELQKFEKIDIEFSKSFDEFKKGNLSYFEFLKEFKKELSVNLSEEETKEILSEINKNIEDLINTNKINNKMFIETIKDIYKNTIDNLSQIELKTFEKLNKQFKNNEINYETYIKNIQNLLNLSEKQVEELNEIKKYQSNKNYKSMAEELQEKKRNEIEKELINKLENLSEQSKVKENVKLKDVIKNASSVDELVSGLTEKGLKKIFKMSDDETLFDKISDKISKKWDKYKTKKEIEKDIKPNKTTFFDRINKTIFKEVDTFEKETNKTLKNNIKEQEKLNKETNKTLKNNIKEQEKLNKEFITKEKQFEKELKETSTFDKNSNFEYNTKTNNSNYRTKNKRLKKSNIFSKLKTKTGNILSKIGGKTNILSKAGLLVGGEGLLSSLGTIGGIGETISGTIGSTIGSIGGIASTAGEALSSIAALASNPIGWAIGGAALAGAAGYGLYHLMIDDDSEEIMDKLENMGAVEHNFFGNSEIKDWKAIYNLQPKEIDALLRFDDWDDITEKRLKELKSLKKDQLQIIGRMLNSGYLKVDKTGKLIINESKLQGAIGKRLLEDLKNAKLPSDIFEKSSYEILSKVKTEKSNKKEEDKKIKLDNKQEKVSKEIDTKKIDKIDSKENKEINRKSNIKSNIENNQEETFIESAKKGLKTILSFTPLGATINAFSNLFSNENTEKENSNSIILNQLIKKGILEKEKDKYHIKDYKSIWNLNNKILKEIDNNLIDKDKKFVDTILSLNKKDRQKIYNLINSGKITISNGKLNIPQNINLDNKLINKLNPILKTNQTNLNQNNLNQNKQENISKEIQTNQINLNQNFPFTNFSNGIISDILGISNTQINQQDETLEHYLSQGVTNPALLATLTGKRVKDVIEYMNKKPEKQSISLKQNIPEAPKKEQKPIIINNSQPQQTQLKSSYMPPPERISDKSLILAASLL